jgi:hypothetical protein
MEDMLGILCLIVISGFFLTFFMLIFMRQDIKFLKNDIQRLQKMIERQQSDLIEIRYKRFKD